VGVEVVYLVPAEQPVELLARLEAVGEYLPPIESLLDLPPPSVPQGKRPLSEVVQELREQERG
jgi:hypothetical protein